MCSQSICVLCQTSFIFIVSTHLHAIGVRTVRQNVLLQLVMNLSNASGTALADFESSDRALLAFKGYTSSALCKFNESSKLVVFNPFNLISVE